MDDKGCITCGYEHAMQLIRSFGTHPITGKGGPPLSIHKIPHTQDPANCPDGSKKHAWYWRIKEMQKSDYDKLPKRIPEDKPKRGYVRKADKVETNAI